MKKMFIAFMAIAALVAVSCSKDEEKTENTSIEGRWDAPRFADNPEDIAFVAIFGKDNLDLYVIPWGQHMEGTYTYSNGMVHYDITAAYQAYTDVSYNDNGDMISWSWNAGNLDAATLTLSEGFDWYEMPVDEYRQEFGDFEFKINGNTATSTLVGIPDLTFYKK
jgi:hypothetical protein